ADVRREGIGPPVLGMFDDEVAANQCRQGGHASDLAAIIGPPRHLLDLPSREETPLLADHTCQGVEDGDLRWGERDKVRPAMSGGVVAVSQADGEAARLARRAAIVALRV